LAGGQLDGARDGLAERRLARAVLADQRVNLAGIEVEIDSLDGVDAAVDFAAVDDLQHRPARFRCARARRGENVAHGLASAMSSSSRPLPLETTTSPCSVSSAAVMP